MRLSFFNKATNKATKNATRKFAGIAAAMLILPVAVACDPQTPEVVDPDAAESVEEVPAETAVEGDTIVDVAASNGSFNTLVAAIQAAGLVDTLSSEGPFTVFAPTDEAFDALPEDVLDKLLLPENQEVLADILQYHVVSGEVLAADVTTGPVASVGGPDLELVAEGGTVTVNEVPVSMADVIASNGVIHVIDSVLLPPDLDLSAL